MIPENIEEGFYRIENSLYSKYLNSTSSIITLEGRDNQSDSQKWELIYVSNGYYRIRNKSTNLYLTAPNNSISGYGIEQSALDSSKNDRQLGRFTPLESGRFSPNDICKIQSKSQENSSMAMFAEEDYDVVQNVFVEDMNYSDEWILIRSDLVNLISIDSFEKGYDWRMGFNNVENILDSRGYISEHILGSYTSATTQPLSVSDIKNYAENSDIFAIFAHGISSVTDTYMLLDEDGTTKFSSNNIYILAQQRVVTDMSGCELAMFIGCYAADHQTHSLPHAAINAGADYAIGFEEAIGVNSTNAWLPIFFDFYSSGESIEDAAYDAIDEVYFSYDFESTERLYSIVIME